MSLKEVGIRFPPPADLLSCLKHKRDAAAALKNCQIIVTIQTVPIKKKGGGVKTHILSNVRIWKVH